LRNANIFSVVMRLSEPCVARSDCREATILAIVAEPLLVVAEKGRKNGVRKEKAAVSEPVDSPPGPSLTKQQPGSKTAAVTRTYPFENRNRAPQPATILVA
jgi:hypothetical protein